MEKLRFAHLADLHLGGWREKRLTELNFKTFKLAIDRVISEKVDFCVFAGDIFNNAMPSIDIVNRAVEQFMRLKEAKIPLYVIGGSHDYSNTGKSFIELLHNANVFYDVCRFESVDVGKVNLKFTVDLENNANFAGILGRKKGLDKNLYLNLNSETLPKDKFNLFMFHCTLDDHKPDFLKSVNSEITSSFLPEGFDYYAGGHVHTYIDSQYSGGRLSYPGPLFPNNFSELKREKCSFNLCTFDFSTRKTDVERIFIETYEMEHLHISIDNLTPFDAKSKIEDSIEERDIKNKLLLLEVSGVVEGKVSDINVSAIVSKCYDLGALHVLKNTYKLTSSSVEKMNLDVKTDSENIEDEIIKGVLKDSQEFDYEYNLVKSLLKLELAKNEEEKVAQYESRVSEAIDKTFI